MGLAPSRASLLSYRGGLGASPGYFGSLCYLPGGSKEPLASPGCEGSKRLGGEADGLRGPVRGWGLRPGRFQPDHCSVYSLLLAHRPQL